MSTNATIAVQSVDGTYRSVYLHSDGYPEHALTVLNEHYASQLAANALMALGDLSQLQEHVYAPEGHSFETPMRGYTVAYGRDRGESNTAAAVYSDYSSMAFERMQYLYIYDADKQQWVSR